MLQLKLTGDEQAQTAGRRTNFRDLRYTVDTALVLGMIFGTSERIRHTRRAAVDGSEGSSTDFELGEGIEVNVNLILRIAFALRLDFLGLCLWLVLVCQTYN